MAQAEDELRELDNAIAEHPRQSRRVLVAVDWRRTGVNPADRPCRALTLPWPARAMPWPALACPGLPWPAPACPGLSRPGLAWPAQAWHAQASCVGG